MYDDVFIAPTNRFNHRAAQTSINDIDHLPLGSETANTRPVFNDDVLDTTSNAPFIADSTARNSQNNKEELKLLPRSLVGKKSNNDGSTVSDLSAMRQQNLTLDQIAMDYELRWYMEDQINGVWMPFTTAETFKYNTFPFATVVQDDTDRTDS